ncbi:MAG: cysteine--tRNA ligase [Defluviitaleaceae bacterium]|nr:cysteine--tRNA ligase [Defluviitaleaceae bacterium]
MKLYNTLTRKKEEFKPIEDGKVKMYVCGSTVYNLIHIGNARPVVVFDAFRRYLEYKGYEVTYVNNYTDVDDKIINRANEENSDMKTVADKYVAEARKDADGLNAKPATVHPRVTEEINPIIDLIEDLEAKGFAYEKNGTVYFNTAKFSGYGKLSGKNTDDLISGQRVAQDNEKINLTDFVLWKPNKPGEPAWESPWGEGRPGWHIECSAMAKKYLGETIDIHAGGEDLVFPHHENEIAQSEAASGKTFANYWLHNAFLNIDNKKMSKSLGNFFTLREVAERFSYEAVRFFMLSGHYRSPINFSDELMNSAESGLRRIKNCLQDLQFAIEKAIGEEISEAENKLLEQSKTFKINFEESLDDDFNTADALASVFEFVRFANVNISNSSSKTFVKEIHADISELMDVLGFDFSNESKPDEESDEYILDLAKKRDEARKNKDWAVADKIRDELNALNIVIEDTPEGMRIKRK